MIKNSISFLSHSLKFFHFKFLKFSWFGLISILTLHFSITWWLMIRAGEDHLIEPTQWIYFFITTATTVGYGDLSPVTGQGRLVASLIIMPGAVLLFAAFLGKLSSLILTLWKKGMHGTADYSHLKDHIVILGWHRDKTSRMLELLFGDTRRVRREVLLCTSKHMENPCPDRAKFVRADRLTDDDALERAAVADASRIIIYRTSDDQTLATSLAVYATDTKAHIVVWFEDARMVSLVKAHCPEVECHTNITTELLVRSAQDPGSSRIQNQLLSTLEGPTQFSIQVPLDFPGTEFGTLMTFFKRQHEAIVLGIADSATGEDMRLNPDSKSPVVAGQIIYFMSQVRIQSDEVNWQEIY